MFGSSRNKRKDRPISLKDDLKATRKSAIRTAFFVILILSGIVPAMSMIFGTYQTDRFAVGDHWGPLWDTALQTYPLTFAIGVITYSRKEKWFRWGKWLFAASVIVAGALLSNSLSHVTGHGIIEPSSTFTEYRNPLFGIPAAGANYFIGFYYQYGAATFLAAILVGMFAGSTASRLGRHLPENVRDTAEKSIREFVDNKKAA